MADSLPEPPSPKPAWDSPWGRVRAVLPSGYGVPFTVAWTPSPAFLLHPFGEVQGGSPGPRPPGMALVLPADILPVTLGELWVGEP